ncbi:YicC family protein [soil metagenome]
MKSMTGFGKAVCELPQKKITVEIRSLNSRQLDLNIRMPSVYREKESEVRSELSKTAERGKIDVSIFVEGTSEASLVTINTTLINAYHAEFKKIAETIGEDRKDFLSLIMRMPDVLKQDKQDLDENEWKMVFSAFKTALDAFGKFREDEGAVLANELSQRIGIIGLKLSEVAVLDPQRAIAVRERLQKHLSEASGSENVDHNRFEQELIYYLEKLDITEEKLRLQTHLDYFLGTMKEPGAGRKLGFIAQEIGREINTIGSKANDANIQMIVVQMKDELEKIKEQLLNVL